MQVSLRSQRVKKEGGTPFPHELKWEEDMKSHLHNGFLVRGPAKTDSREVSSLGWGGARAGSAGHPSSGHRREGQSDVRFYPGEPGGIGGVFPLPRCPPPEFTRLSGPKGHFLQGGGC